ncbi:hypothetical protein D3C83_130900 [compost metagenome]
MPSFTIPPAVSEFTSAADSTAAMKVSNGLPPAVESTFRTIQRSRSVLIATF